MSLTGWRRPDLGKSNVILSFQLLSCMCLFLTPLTEKENALMRRVKIKKANLSGWGTQVSPELQPSQAKVKRKVNGHLTPNSRGLSELKIKARLDVDLSRLWLHKAKLRALFTAVPGKPSICLHLPADQSRTLIQSKMLLQEKSAQNLQMKIWCWRNSIPNPHHPFQNLKKKCCLMFRVKRKWNWF